MFCTNCGNEVAENAVVCVKCGSAPRSSKKFCYNCGAAIEATQIVCVKCGVSLSAAGTGKGPAGTQSPTGTSQARSSSLINQIFSLLKPAELPPRTADIEALAAGPSKSKTVYILLGLFVGGWGIHNFYAGYRQRALAALLCSIIPPCCCLLGIFSLIGAIQDLIKTRCDAAGRPLI